MSYTLPEYRNVSHIGGSNKTMWLSRLLFRQNNVDLNYETRRFNDAHAPGRPRNAGVIRIIDDSFPAYDRGWERERTRLGVTEPGQVSRVTSHIVLSSRGLSIDRGWTDRCDGSRWRKNIASDNWNGKLIKMICSAIKGSYSNNKWIIFHIYVYI